MGETLHAVAYTASERPAPFQGFVMHQGYFIAL